MVNNEMNSSKNNGGLKALVVILIIAVIGLSAYLVYDKVISKNKTGNKPKTENHISNGNNNEEKNDNKNIKTGDLVTIGTEKFYVISSDDTNVRMLTKYNLDIEGANKVYKGTGLQDENVLGTLRWSTIDDSYGTIAFASGDNDNYWNFKANSYVYNEKSNLYNYVEKYVSSLNTNNGINVKGSLLTFEDIKKLGCVNDYSCVNAPKWLTSSTYWLGSTDENGFVLIVSHPQSGKYGITLEGGLNDYNIGVRPVIEISKEELKKFDIKENDYEQLEKKYSDIKYVEDSKYIVVIDNKILKLIDVNDKLISNLYTFDVDSYKLSEAIYKITDDRLCTVSQDGIYVFINNGLKGNDEKLYAIYYNEKTGEKSDLEMQDVMGSYGKLISCK